MVIALYTFSQYTEYKEIDYTNNSMILHHLLTWASVNQVPFVLFANTVADMKGSGKIDPTKFTTYDHDLYENTEFHRTMFSSSSYTSSCGNETRYNVFLCCIRARNLLDDEFYKTKEKELCEQYGLLNITLTKDRYLADWCVSAKIYLKMAIIDFFKE
jgi:nucleoside-diphosphate-sugar epimerase